MNTLPSPFDFFQIAYVAADIDRAAQLVHALYRVDHLQVNRDVEIQTRAGTARAHFGLAFIGNRQLEIIQPAGGADGVYREALPHEGAGLRMHHAGRLVTDEAEWLQIQAWIVAGGHATPVAGVFSQAGVPLMHYLYADTRQFLGHYLEFMLQTEAGAALFAQVPRF